MGLGGNVYCSTVYRNPEVREFENLGVGGRIVELRDVGWLNVGWICQRQVSVNVVMKHRVPQNVRNASSVSAGEGQCPLSYMSAYRNWRGKNGIREWRIAPYNGLNRVSPYLIVMTKAERLSGMTANIQCVYQFKERGVRCEILAANHRRVVAIH
jgi:hypothetical protein